MHMCAMGILLICKGPCAQHELGNNVLEHRAHEELREEGGGRWVGARASGVAEHPTCAQAAGQANSAADCPLERPRHAPRGSPVGIAAAEAKCAHTTPHHGLYLTMECPVSTLLFIETRNRSDSSGHTSARQTRTNSRGVMPRPSLISCSQSTPGTSFEASAFTSGGWIRSIWRAFESNCYPRGRAKKGPKSACFSPHHALMTVVYTLSDRHKIGREQECRSPRRSAPPPTTSQGSHSRAAGQRWQPSRRGTACSRCLLRSRLVCMHGWQTACVTKLPFTAGFLGSTQGVLPPASKKVVSPLPRKRDASPRMTLCSTCQRRDQGCLWQATSLAAPHALQARRARGVRVGGAAHVGAAALHQHLNHLQAGQHAAVSVAGVQGTWGG